MSRRFSAEEIKNMAKAAAAFKSMDSLSGIDARMEALAAAGSSSTDESARRTRPSQIQCAAEARHPRLAQGRHRQAPANGR